jgi:hypothetical protein
VSLAFPGAACRYHRLGACLYSEAANPGLAKKHACARMTALTREWDDFLDRADGFALSEPDAARIWNAREHAALSASSLCPHGQADLADCPYYCQCACLLNMPRCHGICERYRAAALRG